MARGRAVHDILLIMVVTTSVTLSEELLDEIDRVDSNRSAFLERAGRQYLAQSPRQDQSDLDLKDIEAYEQHALHLNSEAADVLEYQILPE